MTQILTEEQLIEKAPKLQKDTIFFSHFLLPEMFYSKSADFHYELAEAMNDPDIRVLIVIIFRGGAKTSICQGYITQKVVHNEHKVILYLSDTSDQAETHTETIRNELEHNDMSKTLY